MTFITSQSITLFPKFTSELNLRKESVTIINFISAFEKKFIIELRGCSTESK